MNCLYISRIRKFLGSNKVHIALVLLVLGITILLRLLVLTSPTDTSEWVQLRHSDYNEDFLVANHIIKYGEIAWNGPFGILGSLWVSPLYFYFLSGLLLIYPDIKFLALASATLQIISVLGVYVLGRILFGKITGLIAMVFFASAAGIVWQSHMVWQPHIMQPIAILTYILLALGYKRKDKILVQLSIITFLTSMAFHYSMLAMIPAFIILVFMTMRSMLSSTKDYLWGMMIALITLVILHAPSLLFALNSKNSIDFSKVFRLSETLEKSLFTIGENMIGWVYTLFNFFLDSGVPRCPFSSSEPITHVAILVVVVSAIMYFLRAPAKKESHLVSALGITILSFLFLAAFIGGKCEASQWYLTPIMGLFVIFIAEMVRQIGRDNIRLSILRWGAIIGLVYIISSTGGNAQLYINAVNLKGFVPKISTIFKYEDGVKNADPMLQYIASEVRRLAVYENDMFFFNFHHYRNGLVWAGDFGEESFWVPLENEFKTKLVEIDSLADTDYSPIARNPKFTFLVCHYNTGRIEDSEAKSNEDCLNAFSNQVPEYKIKWGVYTSDSNRGFYVMDKNREWFEGNRYVYLAERVTTE